MVAPQAGQKREDGSIGLPHLEQNMGVSGRLYFAIERGSGEAIETCVQSLTDNGQAHAEETGLSLVGGPKPVLVDNARAAWYRLPQHLGGLGRRKAEKEANANCLGASRRCRACSRDLETGTKRREREDTEAGGWSRCGWRSHDGLQTMLNILQRSKRKGKLTQCRRSRAGAVSYSATRDGGEGCHELCGERPGRPGCFAA